MSFKDKKGLIGKKEIRPFSFFHKEKSKKGMLLAEETLKMVIAVIVVGILVYFLASLYFSGDNVEIERAEGTMGRIENATASGGETSRINGAQPVGWYLFSFVEGAKPNQCAGQSCVCVCDSSGIISNTFQDDPQAKQCSEEGACSIVEGLENFEPIEFKTASEGLTNLRITKSDGSVVISEAE